MVIRKSIISHIAAVHGSPDADSCIDVPIDREITMLSLELIERAERVYAVSIKPGDSGETITCQGLDVASLEVGNLLSVGDALLTVSSIGRLDTFQIINRSDLPPLLQQHGIYLRVLHVGSICAGNKISVN